MANTLQDAFRDLLDEIEDAIPGVNTLDELLRNVDRLTDTQTRAIGNALMTVTEIELDAINQGLSNVATGLADRVEENAQSVTNSVRQSESNIRNTVLHTSQITYDKLESLEQSMGGFSEGIADMTSQLVESFEENTEQLSQDIADVINEQKEVLRQQIQESIDEVIGSIDDVFDDIDDSILELNNTIAEGNTMLVEATIEQTKIMDKRLDKLTDLIVSELDDSSDQIANTITAQTIALVGAEAASTTAMVAGMGAIATAITSTGTAQATATGSINATIAGVIAAVTAWLAANAIDPEFSIEKFLGEIMSEIMQAQFNVAQNVYEDFDKDVQ